MTLMAVLLGLPFYVFGRKFENLKSKSFLNANLNLACALKFWKNIFFEFNWVWLPWEFLKAFCGRKKNRNHYPDD